MKSNFPSLTSIGAVALANTSMGSPSSRLAWQTLEVGGWPGNCQFGAALLMKGLANDSAVSCVSPVTSWKPRPKIPGEIQLWNKETQRSCGTAPSRKKVWKPRTQQPPGTLGLFALRLNRKVFGVQTSLRALVVKLPRLISFTTSLSKKKLNSGLSIRTNVLPSAAFPV